MAPVTPKITLSTPCRGCSPCVGTGGRDRDCSISWAWCRDAASSPVASTPRAGLGQLAGGDAGIAVGLGLGGQGTPFRFGSAQSTTTSRHVVVQVVGARAVGRATGPERYGGSRPSAQRPTVVEMGCTDQAGARVPCSGRDTRHAGAADRLGSAPGARRLRPPATRTGPGGADHRPATPRAPRRPRTSGNHREDVLRGSASSLPRAVPPVHRPHRRRRRRRRQPEGRRGQDDVGGLARARRSPSTASGCCWSTWTPRPA